jgi:hypothetical protein
VSAFTCPRCGAVSHHPDDLANGYCGRCHAFTGDSADLAERPIGLICPWCNQVAALVISDQQAFCETDGCQMFMWDPTQTLTELLFSPLNIIDLRKDSQ